MAMYMCPNCGKGVSSGENHNCRPIPIKFINSPQNCNHIFDWKAIPAVCVLCGTRAYQKKSSYVAIRSNCLEISVQSIDKNILISSSFCKVRQ